MEKITTKHNNFKSSPKNKKVENNNSNITINFSEKELMPVVKLLHKIYLENALKMNK